MLVKGGGITSVCIILNFGFLFTKGSNDKTKGNHELTTSNLIGASGLATEEAIDQSDTIIPTNSPSKTNNLTGSGTTTPTPTSVTIASSSSLSTASHTSVTITSSSSLSTVSHTNISAVVSTASSMSASTDLPKTSFHLQMTSITSTTQFPNISTTTDTSNSSTLSSASLSTKHVPTNKGSSGLQISGGAALGIFLVALILVSVGILIYYFIKKKGKLSCRNCKICLPKRRRRSSTSSRGPLTQDDATFVNITYTSRPERELFSIGDQDGGQDGRQSSMQRRGTEDDYFYDEIFGKSAFVDETTNRANTHLTVDDDDDDDLGGLNVPDLIFKKPKRI